MSGYQLNKPYIWTGGKCPLPEGSKVTAVFEDGDALTNVEAHELCWDHDWDTLKIIFFTPTLILSKPRTVFINEYMDADGSVFFGGWYYPTEEAAKDMKRHVNKYVRTVEFVEKLDT